MKKKYTLEKIMLSIVLLSIFVVLLCMLLLTASRCTRVNRLIDAIEAEDVFAVQKMLDEGADPNETDLEPGRWMSFFEMHADRPITIACRTGNVEIVRLLIDYGAEVGDIDHTDWSPLMSCLFRYEPDDKEIVKLLLDAGADPFCEDTPILEAAEMSPCLGVKGEKTYSEWYDEDIAKEITEIIIMLLGDESVMYEHNGRTLLMHAALGQNMYLIEYLIENGCDPTYENQYGQTAYDYALRTNNETIINYFAQYEQP